MTFSSSTSLEQIGNYCFVSTGIEEVNIPDGVRELCNSCFRECKNLRRVMFGPSSSLERIGDSCFAFSGIEEVNIPDSVRELCDHCFRECKNLRRVTFGSSSSLERIGTLCFWKSGLLDFEIPSTVGAIGGGAFGECLLSGALICRDGCRFRVLDGLVLSHDCELWCFVVCLYSRRCS